MKKFILTFSIVLFLIPLMSLASGERLKITPFVIDERALERDIITETVSITNITAARLNVYAYVNNLNAETGEEEFKARADVVLTESLANWIDVQRGVIEIGPGETVEIPITIAVNVNAKPGKYHALIRFGYGKNRAFVESRPERSETLQVNVEVVEDVKERLQLGTFTTDKFYLSGDSIPFSYNLENIGNKDLQPKGEVRIYDRNGREVGSVPANGDGTVIKPNEIGQIASAWSAGGNFGKYKALLDVEYGSQLGTVNDTIYFWIIPWKQLLLVFLILGLLVTWGTYRIYGRYEPAKAAPRPNKRNKDAMYIDDHVYIEPSIPPSEHHVVDMRK